MESLTNTNRTFTLVGLIVWILVVVVRLAVVSYRCIVGQVDPNMAAVAMESALPLMGLGGSLAVVLSVNFLRHAADKMGEVSMTKTANGNGTEKPK